MGGEGSFGVTKLYLILSKNKILITLILNLNFLGCLSSSKIQAYFTKITFDSQSFVLALKLKQKKKKKRNAYYNHTLLLSRKKHIYNNKLRKFLNFLSRLCLVSLI